MGQSEARLILGETWILCAPDEQRVDKSDDTFMSRYTFTFDAAMRVESQLIHLRKFHMRNYLVANCSEFQRAACRYSEVPLSCVRGKNT